MANKGLTLAAELGRAHRFLVYNASVHLYRILRPLLEYNGETAAATTALLEGVLKALAAAEEPDAAWRLQLSMQLARCMERCGRRKDAGALLGTCAPLAAEAKKREDEESKLGGTKRTGPPLQELLLQLQAHMVGDDAAALKKLRDECQPDQRKRCLVLTQLLCDGGAWTRPEGTSLFGRAGGGGRGGGDRPGARGGARDQGRRRRHQARRGQRAAQLVPARRRARGARLTGSPPRAPRDRGPLRAVVHGGAPAVEPRALGVHQGGRASWARSTRATGPSRRACTQS